MNLRAGVATLAVVAAGLAGLWLLLPGVETDASPVHVAGVFFDGVDHGDFRQTCSVWQAGVTHMSQCETVLAAELGQAAALGMFGGYQIVPRSEKEWRERWHGKTVEAASVKVAYTAGGPSQKLTCHLLKRDGRWVVQSLT